MGQHTKQFEWTIHRSPFASFDLVTITVTQYLRPSSYLNHLIILLSLILFLLFVRIQQVVEAITLAYKCSFFLLSSLPINLLVALFTALIFDRWPCTTNCKLLCGSHGGTIGIRGCWPQLRIAGLSGIRIIQPLMLALV